MANENKRFLQTVVISPRGLRTGSDHPFRGPLSFPLDLVSFETEPGRSFLKEIGSEHALREVMEEFGFAEDEIDKHIKDANRPRPERQAMPSYAKQLARQALHDDFWTG